MFYLEIIVRDDQFNDTGYSTQIEFDTLDTAQAALDRAASAAAQEEKDAECDECGASIPDETGGSIANKHHKPTC